ncbi:nitrilase family protein [Paracoccus shandongensis]|uniref:nitrilase family protein n=1 Tax=Paracoccus shandongensis TaxID=2816048 RepID=UPI001F2AA725|nr:nitrilase family protein [Paracoccus shandongensis]
MEQEDRLSQAVTVACLQFEPQFGAVDANLAEITRLASEAAAQGARILVLPELADTGYVFESHDEVERLAAPIPDGRAAQHLIALARDLGVYIASGLCENADGHYYNSAIFCGPEGYLGTFRKLHLWNAEKLFFEPGNLGLPVFDTAYGRVGVAICYDGWFPETFRGLVAAGAELICVPTNWVPMPDQPPNAEPMANVLHKAAAHSNGVSIACADRVGVERGQLFLGCSLIVGPRGWPLAGPASGTEPEILIADVVFGNRENHRRLSDRNNVWEDRRTDLYT